ncbi:3'-5' exonuclease [Roseateles violae]|uniref:Exonuclease n=1 Tax=Roseateles violae TaxID=3058042 RepID=A0ABT8DW27_9BURK|nr:hypothetical protein [Pelomonas sp. PFR6]MDN3922505.1 hypothetical protein [Pelomonas sp. PFR6]
MSTELHTASLPAILDLEASGFGRGSYPIEVGFVDGQGRSFCSLIRPVADWQHWDERAQALHGISREALLAHGRPPEWIAAEMNARLAGQTVYCDGWGNDYPWLARMFDAAGMQPRFRLDDLRRLLSEDEAAGWHGLTEQMRRELKTERHRASSDARILQLALQRLRQQRAGTAAL